MNNPFKRLVSQYLKFSRSDRNAILILGALILVVIIANVFVKNMKQEPSFNLSEYSKILSEWNIGSAKEDLQVKSLFHFNPNYISKNRLDSLQIPDFIKRNIISYRNAGGKFYSVLDFRKIYGVNDSIFEVLKPYLEIEEEKTPVKSIGTKSEKEIVGYFDPNKADFGKLKEFGFNNFLANNLVNFRKKGGFIKDVADLKKIYGMDSVFYSKIIQYVQIEKKVDEIFDQPRSTIISIEINSADSTEFVKLRGIGPVYAMRILKYRNLLGGFYSKEQLLEVYNFPEETFYEIKNHISIDTTLIKKIRINFVEYSELLRHPYLNKKQVGSILNFRNKNGIISDISKIQVVESLDSETLMKLRPYFTCR